jgi:hypothetical protein
LGVRGLGEKQRIQRYLTDSKIVSFLTVTPFTYDKLWKVSRIHRNTLRSRLNYLVAQGIVIKHKYSIPNNYHYWGCSKYRYPDLDMLPIYNRTYYLLNCSKPKSKQLVSYYLNRKEKDWIDKRCNDKNMNLLPYISSLVDKFSIITILENKPMTVMTRDEIREYALNSIDLYIYSNRVLRQYDLEAIKERVYLHTKGIKDKIANNAIKITNYFIQKGFTLLDVLIRCCNEETEIRLSRNHNKEIPYKIKLPMMHYCTMWNILKNAGFLRNINQHNRFER